MPGEPPLDGCWDWRGSTIKSGYGQIISRAYGYTLAHRVSHQLFIGPIPLGLEVIHSCDRPVCVQPLHLEAATHAENMRQALERGRYASHGPKPILSDDDIAAILTSDLSERKLGRLMGVSHTTIGEVRRGRYKR